MVLSASFIGKCLILVLLIRQLMHNIFLSRIMYHQPYKMSPAQKSRVSSAPLGMTHTQQDTCEAREVQSLQVSQKSLLILFRMGCIQEWFAWGYSTVYVTLKAMAWALLSELSLPLYLGWALLPLAQIRELNMLHHFLSTKKSECWKCSFFETLVLDSSCQVLAGQ